MCGYIGNISFSSLNLKSIEKNNKIIECRGPDEKKILGGLFDDYFENNDKLNFSFAFNRLAIVDLGENTSQPMFNFEKKTVCMFNGEIFNHDKLRKSMESDGIKFRSNHSDTEVVLNGLTYYGKPFIEKMIGQFSIAFYESDTKRLLLCIDRLGQKPLFFAKNNSNIVFGSNLIAVLNEYGKKNINKKSFDDYINYGVVPSPDTIFEGVYKLEPSQIIELDFNNNGISTNTKKYWSIEDNLSEETFNSETFYSLLSDSIKLRENADVPVANFLSGGIDSTYIIKDMADRGLTANTFSVVFENKKYDERKWSREVSKKYDTNHIEYEINLDEFDNFVIESIEQFDEPYSDPSTVPSYLISKLISKNYKTAISGDGGDELLGGYSRTNTLLFNQGKYKNAIKYLNYIYPNYLGTGNNFLKYSSNLAQASSSFFSDKNLLSYFGLKDHFTYENKFFNHLDNRYKSLLFPEYSFFLSEMMLLKVDRTSMASSVEVRSPFVDHRLVEYIFSTRATYIDKNNPKKLLKDILSEDFNNDFLNRPKQGFVFSVEDWVFKNKQLVLNAILDVNNFEVFDKSKLDKLYLRKTRINGLRLWRIFLINRYLDLNL